MNRHMYHLTCIASHRQASKKPLLRQVDYYPEQVTFKAMGKGSGQSKKDELQLTVRKMRSRPLAKFEKLLAHKNKVECNVFEPRHVDLLKN